MFVSPLNFAMVSAGVYRSGYPGERNFPFLARLKLKTILHVGLKKYLPANVRFAEEQGIRVLQCPLSGNKEPFVSITEESLAAALSTPQPRSWQLTPLVQSCCSPLAVVWITEICWHDAAAWVSVPASSTACTASSSDPSHASRKGAIEL